jgi:septal ring factor EnvC (AmiA/AmiB activator)
MQHFSEIAACSPRSNGSSTGDFFLLLEAEMAQAAIRFKEDLNRINQGISQRGASDELREAHARIAELETALETVLKERDELENELSQIERVMERLSDENRELSEQVRSQKQEAEKSCLADKYRRALVYMDSLQSRVGRRSPTLINHSR